MDNVTINKFEEATVKEIRVAKMLRSRPTSLKHTQSKAGKAIMEKIANEIKTEAAVVSKEKSFGIIEAKLYPTETEINKDVKKIKISNGAVMKFRRDGKVIIAQVGNQFDKNSEDKTVEEEKISEDVAVQENPINPIDEVSNAVEEKATEEVKEEPVFKFPTFGLNPYSAIDKDKTFENNQESDENAVNEQAVSDVENDRSVLNNDVKDEEVHVDKEKAETSESKDEVKVVVAQLNAIFEKKTEQIKAEHKVESEQIKAEHKAEVEQIKAEHKAEVEKIKAEYEAKLKEKDDEIEKAHEEAQQANKKTQVFEQAFAEFKNDKAMAVDEKPLVR